ncbi:glycosyltransferase [Allomuricauda sp. NBRC 101325]|uniref:glycosyltransferase n=1 Tax=Allomuricauda sp. NBRC 101325 TaxID=1113758 RepID=UPI0024A20780|nr:glycosyltransferase [Muricauda sp. NBRC 101325]GLU44580.1 glycosyl transferase family 1 [Muricauda sp. NBRC 101325]
MKIIVTSIGTRGDMEPLLAIGEILKEKGHEVICLFPEQFRSLAEDSGFGFASLGTSFIEMLNGTAGTIAMGGGKMGWKKMKAYLQLVSMQQKVNKEMILLQEAVIEKEMPDRIVHNAKVMYPIIWGLKHREERIWVSPVPFLHYVKNHSHVAFNGNYGSFINKLSYRLANFGLIKTISGSLKWLSTPNALTTKEIKKSLFENKSIYTISPTLFERPDYWPNNIQVLGYHERKKTTNWKPSEELAAFLQTHPKVILVTFGSMINTDPPEKTKIILDILERNNIPAIINTAAGGLIKPKNYNGGLFYFVNNIPYDWICPKLYAMIHHGGSGTTHTAIKYGCASLIIPHIIDQYVWNKIIHQKGVGPLGIDVGRISVSKLEPKILDLYTNPSYKKKAEEMGEKMMQESYRDEIYNAIVDLSNQKHIYG